jgi:hypothetical protein
MLAPFLPSLDAGSSFLRLVHVNKLLALKKNK